MRFAVVHADCTVGSAVQPELRHEAAQDTEESCRRCRSRSLPGCRSDRRPVGAHSRSYFDDERVPGSCRSERGTGLAARSLSCEGSLQFLDVALTRDGCQRRTAWQSRGLPTLDRNITSDSRLLTFKPGAKWRRERDSNPRAPFGANGFQDRRLKPLGHLSVRDQHEPRTGDPLELVSP